MVIVLETTSENRNQKTKYQCYVSGPNQKLHILQIFSKWIPLSEMLFILSFFSKLMGFPSLLLPFQQKCERTRLSRSACPSCALIVNHICCCWWSMCYNRLYKYIVQLHPVNQAKSTQPGHSYKYKPSGPAKLTSHPDFTIQPMWILWPKVHALYVY